MFDPTKEGAIEVFNPESEGAVAVREQPVSSNQFIISDPQDVNVELPDIFNDDDKAKIETANILSDEYGVDNSTVMSGYDNFVYKKYGQVLSPSAVKRKLIDDGLLTDSESDRNDIASISDSVVNGKPIDTKIRGRIRLSSLNKQLARLKESFQQQNNFIEQRYLYQATTTAKPSKPDTIFAEDIKSYTPNELLDFDVFMGAVDNAPSAEVVRDFISKRQSAFDTAIRQQRTESLYNIKVALAKSAETSTLKEFGRGLATGTLQTIRGLAGVVADVAGDMSPESQKLREETTKSLKSPALISPDQKTAVQYIANTLGQTLPYLTAASIGKKMFGLLGAATVGFAIEGENAYQFALENGATEKQAQSERVLVGTINAGIEALQVEKLFKFVNKNYAKNVLVSTIKKNTYKEIAKSGGRLTLEGLKLSFSEGMTELLQEGVSVSVPAFLRNDYAKLPNGKPDWWSIASRLNQAYWGGATAGIFLGGTGRLYNGLQTAKARNDLAASISIFEGINYPTAQNMAIDIMGRNIKTQEEYDETYSELLDKYQPLGDIAELAKEEIVSASIESRPEFQEMMRKSAEGVIEPEPIPKDSLGEDFYKTNREKLSIGIKENIRELARGARLETVKALSSISTRLEIISPKIKYDVRKVFHTTNARIAKYTESAVSFFEAVEKIQSQNLTDYRDLELAVRNSDEGKISYLTQLYGIESQYGKYRNAMDEIFEYANKVGMDVDYTNTYFHREITNLDGLLKELKTTENWSMIQQAFDNKQEQVGGRELTPEEKSNIINSLLRGYNVGQIILARPGATKTRSIGVIDNKLEKYYAPWQESVVGYISTMSKQITIREFFGKQSKDIIKQRTKINRIKTNIHNLKTGQSFANIDETERARRIKNSNVKLAKAETEYEKINNAVLENSIGGYIKDLINNKTIKSDQQKEIAGMFGALFNPKKMDRWLSILQKGVYIDTLSQITNALTQVGELGLSVMRSPTGSLLPIARAFIGQSKIKMSDIYVHEIGQEWVDNQFGKFGNAMLWGLQKMDAIGKEAYINTIVDKYRRTALNNPDKLKGQIKNVFGDETDNVIKELSENKTTENIKLLAFNELADVQPIAISEMPEYYAKGGNMRVFYMLRTFTIKRLDMIRRECFNLMTDPIKKPKDFMRGTARLIWMGFVLLLSDTASDVIKDFFRGKPIELADIIIDNFWQNTLILNKYTLQKSRGEGFGVIAQNFLPMLPTKTLDAVWTDIYNIMKDSEDRRYKGFESPRSIPYLGELYYWWFGKGREKIEAKNNVRRF